MSTRRRYVICDSCLLHERILFVFGHTLIRCHATAWCMCVTQTYTADDAGKGLQDFAICIEMFIAAAAHWYVFPHDEYNAVSQQQVCFALILIEFLE